MLLLKKMKLLLVIKPIKLLIGLILLSIALNGGNVLAHQNMQPVEIRNLIEQAKAAWIARDADTLVRLFTSDGELIVPGQKWQGHDRIYAEVTKFAQQYTDVKIEICQIIVEGDRAAVEWIYEDIEIATGIRNRAEDAIMINFESGRISRWREYFDTKTPAKKD